MKLTPNAPLLHIENVTMNKAAKDASMIWLSKNWEGLREGVYIDDSTFRIDLNTDESYKELKGLLGIGEDIRTIYIHFSQKPKKDEFIQVFLNKDFAHGLLKTYGDIGWGRIANTPEYKKRAKLMEGIAV